MQKLLAAAMIIGVFLGAGSALAKGGNDGRNHLQEELAEQRAKNQSSSGSEGFFSSIFGSSESKAEATDEKRKGRQPSK